jgi:hypothetical protein
MKAYKTTCVLLLFVVSLLLLVHASAFSGPLQLTQAEKASIVGGVCHSCPDCHEEKTCGGVSKCTTGATCDEPFSYDSVKTKCVESGSLLGGCGNEGSHDCYKHQPCSCEKDPPNWKCTAGTWSAVITQTYYRDPCW